MATRRTTESVPRGTSDWRKWRKGKKQLALYVSPAFHRSLKELATREGRSLHKQMLYMLENQMNNS